MPDARFLIKLQASSTGVFLRILRKIFKNTFFTDIWATASAPLKHKREMFFYVKVSSQPRHWVTHKKNDISLLALQVSF